MEKPPQITNETIDYATKKVEQEISEEMPISYTELQSVCESEPSIYPLFKEMVGYAQAYVQDVWNMRELIKNKSEYTEEEWAELFAKADSDRTRLHDTYIDSIAILVRNMGEYNLDNDWARALMPAGKLDRAACGRFAIMLVYSRYVNSE